MKYASALTLAAALFVTPAAANSTPLSDSASGGNMTSSVPVIGAVGEVVQAGGLPSSARYEAPAPNFFERLMELERRKNAWLLRTFFGR